MSSRPLLKASQLVERLQNHIHLFGDHPILVLGYEGGLGTPELCVSTCELDVYCEEYTGPHAEDGSVSCFVLDRENAV